MAESGQVIGQLIAVYKFTPLSLQCAPKRCIHQHQTTCASVDNMTTKYGLKDTFDILFSLNQNCCGLFQPSAFTEIDGGKQEIEFLDPHHAKYKI